MWDYPRPPQLEADDRLVEVRHGDRLIASSRTSYRVLETASPPTFYLPPANIETAALIPTPKRTLCEWKGVAHYWVLKDASELGEIAWSYPDPNPAFEAIRDWLAFYPGRADCYLDGERVQAQTGGFYGGWITHEILGPFKGDPGTEHW